MSHGERDKIEYKIDFIFSKCDEPNFEDDELKAELAKYLCVLSSGFIEACCRDIVKRYVSGKAHPKIVDYVVWTVDRFRNPKANRVLDLIGGFDKDGMDALRDNLDESVKDGVDSIVDNRNRIAHGRDVNVTIHRFREYHGRVCTFIKELERHFPSGA